MQSKRFWIFFSLILLSASAVGFAYAAVAQEAQKQKAQISGRVFSADGKPLAKVTISAFGRGSTSGDAKTDQGGYYTIEVEPGTYQIRAERKGYFTVWYKLEDSTSNEIPLTVEAGQQLTNINFRLSKGGVITGRILDEEGDPLIGESVTITSKDKERPFGSSRGDTDDRGIYRVYGLPSGNYCVSARPNTVEIVRREGMQMRMPQPGQPTYYPGVTSLDEATEVAVTEGAETTGIDFRLKTGPTARGKIVGKITRKDTRQPVTGAMVHAFSSDHPEMPASATSDSEGQYELKGLSPGKYTVQAVHTFMQSPDEELAPPWIQEVTVDKGPVELNFEFERGGQVSGQVVLEGNRLPKDVGNLYLRLQPVGGARFFGGMRSPKPNREGRFTMNPSPSGTYRLEVTSPNGLYYLKSVILDNTDVRESGIPVESGETREVLVVLSDAGATVKGQVIGQKGPMPGALVMLGSLELLAASSEDFAFPYESRTDQRGKFEFQSIRPGRYFIFAFPQRPTWRGSEALVEFLRSHQDRLRMIDLKANETKDVQIAPVAAKQP
jgi:hypothetical protein